MVDPDPPLQPQGTRSLADEFLIEEFKELQQEKRSLIDGIEKARNFALIGTAAFWSWILVNPNGIKGAREVTFVAPLFVLLLVFQWRLQQAAVMQVAGHIIELERRANHLGWETHLKIARSTNWEWFNWAFWLSVFFVNLVVSVLVISLP